MEENVFKVDPLAVQVAAYFVVEDLVRMKVVRGEGVYRLATLAKSLVMDEAFVFTAENACVVGPNVVSVGACNCSLFAHHNTCVHSLVYHFVRALRDVNPCVECAGVGSFRSTKNVGYFNAPSWRSCDACSGFGYVHREHGRVIFGYCGE